jgi:hypothetical protein
VPADEEFYHTMENAKEEGMDGSSIVCHKVLLKALPMLTAHAEASVGPPRALREHAECEQGLSTGTCDTTAALTGPGRPTGRR